MSWCWLFRSSTSSSNSSMVYTQRDSRMCLTCSSSEMSYLQQCFLLFLQGCYGALISRNGSCQLSDCHLCVSLALVVQLALQPRGLIGELQPLSSSFLLATQLLLLILPDRTRKKRKKYSDLKYILLIKYILYAVHASKKINKNIYK